MEFIIILGAALIIFLVIVVTRVPIMIAKSRGITGSELTTISILSWLGLLIGITWIVALVLSLVWKPSNWIEKDQPRQYNNLSDWETLEKLHILKEQGVITQAEFDMEKIKIMYKNQ